jgi:hypothetical protein
VRPTWQILMTIGFSGSRRSRMPARPPGPMPSVDPPSSFQWILQRFNKGRAARALAALALPRISAEFCRFDGVFGPALRAQDGAGEG